MSSNAVLVNDLLEKLDEEDKGWEDEEGMLADMDISLKIS